MGNNSRFEDEFKASQTYRALKVAKDKINSEEFQNEIHKTINNVAEKIQTNINSTKRDFAAKKQAGNSNFRRPMNTNSKQRKTKQPKVCPEGMMEVRRKSPAPFYAVAAASIIYALIFPLYRIFDYFLFVAICILSGYVASKIFKGKIEYVEKPKEEEKPKSRTGNEQVDALLDEGYKYIDELITANDAIHNETVSAQIERMEQVARRIFEFVEKNPEKAGQIRKFMNYYLPTTLKLLNSYYKLTRQGVKGDNIAESIIEIERVLYTIVKAFERQLDALFQDEAIDVSTDIAVLESMLKQEDLI